MPAVVPMKSDFKLEYDSNIVELFPKQAKLRKDGTPKIIVQNKKRGRKSEVYPFSVQDLKLMHKYFADHEWWIHYLLFVFGCNMARRINDTLSLTWEHVFNPKTGVFREELLEIQEDKTDKLANPRINSACRSAINLYIAKTGCDPSLDGYAHPIFMQLSGTHRGSVLTDDGHRKAIKKAAADVGITYNVGTHSARKTFGMISRMLHPNDYESMELLQTIFNHSDVKTTKNYIGLTKQKVNSYYDDFGDFFTEHIEGNTEYTNMESSPIITLDQSDLYDVLKMAYEEGRNNAQNPDPIAHVDSITALIQIVQNLAK